MGQRSSGGRDMQVISRHEMDGHRHKLRQIFSRSFRVRRGETTHNSIFGLEEKIVPSSKGPVASYSLARSASTEVARNDRGDDIVCAVLFERDGTRILCSYFEQWNIIRPKNNLQFSFSKAGMTFLMGFQEG